LVNLGTGYPAEAQRLIARQVPSHPMSTAAYGYAKLGNTAKAMQLVREMDSTSQWSADAKRASVMLATGDTAGALRALEQSAKTTGPLWVWIISPRDPAFDPVRHSPRFAKLVHQAGLDTAWVTAPRR
jgi:pentatricopeptide repeat protein